MSEREGSYEIFLDAVKGDQIDVSPIGMVEDPDPNYSGAAILDAQLGTPFPCGSMCEIYGEAGTGKTTVALSILGAAQQVGKRVAYIDMEKTLYRSLLTSIASIDLEAKDDDGYPMFSRIRAKNGESAFKAIQQFATEFPGSVCVVDSVDALVPEAILSAEVGSQTIGKLAKLMSDGCRRLAEKLPETKSTVIFVNQTRSNPGIMYGDSTVRPGGKALNFYTTQRIKLKNVPKANQIKDDDGNVIGHKAGFYVDRNKCQSPFVEGHITIRYGYGIWESQDLLKVATDLALIEVKGKGRLIMPEQFHKFSDKLKTSEFSKNVVAILDQNPEALGMLKEMVRKCIEGM